MKYLFKTLFLAGLLTACTDYVQDLEDQRDEWRESLVLDDSSYEVINLSSNEDDSFEKSSSSTYDEEAESSSSKKNPQSSESSKEISSSSNKGKNSSSSTKSCSSTKQASSSSQKVYSSSSNNRSSSSTGIDSTSYETSGSSNNQTSSSSKESWAFLNPAISYGEMTDDRDGQVYKTVVIGAQTWMAENLNYEYSFGTFCYQQQDSNCVRFGKLYTWAAAMDSIGSFSQKGKNCGYLTQCSPTYPVQGVCPNNWHLPTIDEWKELFEFESINYVAKFLKSATGDWRGQWGSTNSSGFSAVPSGGLDYRNQNMGDNAFFWTSSISQEEPYSNSFYTFILHDQQSANYDNSSSRISAFSIRCLKNTPNNTIESSSSENTASSSSAITTAEPCKTKTEDNCEYGIIEDTRDSHVYKTVKIGSQWWMAENLNFETNKSSCHDTDCLKYGRYYSWSDAMDSIGVYSKKGKGCGFRVDCTPSYPVQGVCPSGWHLPDTAEVSMLLTAVGDKNTAGEKLKSLTDWVGGTACTNANGSDSYGFSLYPAGYQDYLEQIYSAPNGASFWTSTSNGNNEHAYYSSFTSCSQKASTSFSPNTKKDKRTIRCVKD